MAEDMLWSDLCWWQFRERHWEKSWNCLGNSKSLKIESNWWWKLTNCSGRVRWQSGWNFTFGIPTFSRWERCPQWRQRKLTPQHAALSVCSVKELNISGQIYSKSGISYTSLIRQIEAGLKKGTLRGWHYWWGHTCYDFCLQCYVDGCQDMSLLTLRGTVTRQTLNY